MNGGGRKGVGREGDWKEKKGRGGSVVAPLQLVEQEDGKKVEERRDFCSF